MICVDELSKPLGKTVNWSYKNCCHMFSDDNNIDELHKFAALIGYLESLF